MKKTKKVKTALMLMLACAALFSGCSTVAPATTTPATEPDGSAISTANPETTPAQTVPTATGKETVDPSVLSDLRVLVSSDVHCTDLQEWYGVKYRDRMQGWVDSVLKEHKEDPFDLVVINGDISLDYWINGGSVISKGKGTASIFVDEYLSQLPEDLPVFIIPGNHEQYSDEDWLEITGNHREGYMVLGGRLFIFLDNFGGGLDPKHHHDGIYTKTDIGYIQELMDKYPEMDVYLFAHYFDTSKEGDEFRSLLKNNDRIKGLFAGHTHKTAIMELGESYGGKTIAQTGNFAYYKDSAKESFWGFRELVISEKDSYSQYIIAESEAIIDGVRKKFERTIRAQVCYYGTAPELPTEADPLAGYVKLYDKVDQSSIDGDVGMKDSNRVQLMLDGQVNTKWCVRPTSADGSVTVTWTMTEKVRVDAYALSTANDHPDRNPDAWTIWGRNSEDEEWQVISKVTKGNLPKELFTVSDVFKVENPKEYKYYKMTLTENFNNRDLYQFSELILLQNK